MTSSRLVRDRFYIMGDSLSLCWRAISAYVRGGFPNSIYAFPAWLSVLCSGLSSPNGRAKNQYLFLSFFSGTVDSANLYLSLIADQELRVSEPGPFLWLGPRGGDHFLVQAQAAQGKRIGSESQRQVIKPSAVYWSRLTYQRMNPIHPDLLHQQLA